MAFSTLFPPAFSSWRRTERNKDTPSTLGTITDTAAGLPLPGAPARRAAAGDVPAAQPQHSAPRRGRIWDSLRGVGTELACPQPPRGAPPAMVQAALPSRAPCWPRRVLPVLPVPCPSLPAGGSAHPGDPASPFGYPSKHPRGGDKPRARD